MSTASRTNVRDDRETPLKWDGMAEIMEVIWGKREGIYFCEGGLDRWNRVDPAGEFFLWEHTGRCLVASLKSKSRPKSKTPDCSGVRPTEPIQFRRALVEPLVTNLSSPSWISLALLAVLASASSSDDRGDEPV